MDIIRRLSRRSSGGASSSLILRYATTSLQKGFENAEGFSFKYIHPDSSLAFHLAFFSGVIGSLAAITVPWRIAFRSPRSEADMILEFLLLIEFVLPSFQAFRGSSGQLIVSWRSMAFQYVRHGPFLKNVVSCFPVGSCASFLSGGWTGPAQWLQVLHLYRVAQINVMCNTLEQDLRFPYAIARFLRFFLIVLFQGHWIGCCWWYLAYFKDFADDTWVFIYDRSLASSSNTSQYIRSIYWGFITLTTTGYGDIIPASDVEATFVVIIVVLNLAIASYITGNMAALATQSDSGTARFREKMASLTRYMGKMHFPDVLQNRVSKHYKLKFDKRDFTNKVAELEDDIPFSLLLEVSDHLHRRLLNRSPLFRGCDERVFNSLCVLLTPQVFTSQQYIQHEGLIDRMMYIVGSGEVEMTYHDPEGSTSTKVLKTGDPFGHITFLFGIASAFSARAISECTVYQLTKDAFDDVLEHFPDDLDQIRKNAIQLTQSIMRSSHFDLLKALMERVKAERIASLCFAAHNGDTERLQRLLASVDVNMRDYSFRTPLHVAASEGNMNVCVMLLEYGAEPLLPDRNGETPIDQAIRYGYMGVANLLKDAVESNKKKKDKAAEEGGEDEKRKKKGSKAHARFDSIGDGAKEGSFKVKGEGKAQAQDKDSVSLLWHEHAKDEDDMIQYFPLSTAAPDTSVHVLSGLKEIETKVTEMTEALKKSLLEQFQSALASGRDFPDTTFDRLLTSLQDCSTTLLDGHSRSQLASVASSSPPPMPASVSAVAPFDPPGNLPVMGDHSMKRAVNRLLTIRAMAHSTTPSPTAMGTKHNRGRAMSVIADIALMHRPPDSDDEDDDPPPPMQASITPTAQVMSAHKKKPPRKLAFTDGGHSDAADKMLDISNATDQHKQSHRIQFVGNEDEDDDNDQVDKTVDLTQKQLCCTGMLSGTARHMPDLQDSVE